MCVSVPALKAPLVSLQPSTTYTALSLSQILSLSTSIKNHSPPDIGTVRQEIQSSCLLKIRCQKKSKKKNPVHFNTPFRSLDPDFIWGERAQENKNCLQHYILTIDTWECPKTKTEDTQRFKRVSTRGVGEIKRYINFTWVCNHSLFGFRRRISTTEELPQNHAVIYSGQSSTTIWQCIDPAYPINKLDFVRQLLPQCLFEKFYHLAKP